MYSLKMIAVAFVTVAAAAQAASAQVAPVEISPNTRTIRVSGMGEFRVKPDLATVQFAVETTGTTAQAAGEANADLMERVIATILGSGVVRDDVQTSGYSVYPEYAYPGRGDESQPPTIRGYRAMNMVSVRTQNLERVGALIDAGLRAGANRLHGVSFELTNTSAAKARALEMAINEARAAAETIARTLGVQLGNVLDASTNAEMPRPYFRAAPAPMDMAAMGSAAMTPIEAGEQTITAMASVVFEIR
jgi:uncharacterized protein YggE